MGLLAFGIIGMAIALFINSARDKRLFEDKMALDTALFEEYERGYNDAKKDFNGKLYRIFKCGYEEGYRDWQNGEKSWYE